MQKWFVNSSNYRQIKVFRYAKIKIFTIIENNIIDGEPVKIKGKTYRECFNKEISIILLCS